MLSQVLATIVTDVPVDMDENLLRSTKWDEKRLREIFTELEFRTFIAVLNDARAIRFRATCLMWPPRPFNRWKKPTLLPQRFPIGITWFRNHRNWMN